MQLGRVDALERDDTGEWRHVDRRAVHDVAHDWLPVDALYLLMPDAADRCERLERGPVDARTAAMALVRHAKLGALLAGPLAADYLERAVRVASAVPVYRLRFPHDFGRLGEVARELIAWHRT
jgi:hypothetical protein